MIFSGRPTAIAIFIASALLGNKDSRCAAIFHDIYWLAYGHSHFYCLRYAWQ